MATEDREVLEKVTRILWYLEDDPSTGRKGMYSRGEDIEQRVKSLEDYVAEERVNKRWINIIVGAVGGALAMLAKYVINIFF